MYAGGVSNGSLANIIQSNYEVLKSWYKNGYFPPFWIFVFKPLSTLFQFIHKGIFYRK